MSILARKNSRGRPKVDSEELRSRVERSLLDRLDAWAAVRGNIGRAEAVRRLLEHALADGGPKIERTHEEHVTRAEGRAAEKLPKGASPERGMAMLRKGKAEAGLAGMKAKRGMRP